MNRMKIDDGATIETFTGLQVHLLDPQPEEICIEDIAHALAMQCRFTGHTKFHFSVAQHSYLVSALLQPEKKLEGLLHDATEAYLGDMSRPLKHFSPVGEEYLKVEAKFDKVLRKKFCLPDTMSDEVKRADNTMLYMEKNALMKPCEWTHEWGGYDIPHHVIIAPWTPEIAEKRFLLFYQGLNYCRSRRSLSRSQCPTLPGVAAP